MTSLIVAAAMVGVVTLVAGGLMTVGRVPDSSITQNVGGEASVAVADGGAFGLKKIVPFIEEMELDGECPAGGEYVTSACARVENYRVRRDLDDVLTVSRVVVSPSGSEQDREVMRVIGGEPIMNMGLAADEPYSIGNDLVRVFTSFNADGAR